MPRAAPFDEPAVGASTPAAPRLHWIDWLRVAAIAGVFVYHTLRPFDLGELVLPVYVVHQPVILAVAFFVVQWPLGILPKWLVVFAISAVVTLACVEVALRTPVTRVLLGARIRPPALVAAAPARLSLGRRPAVPPPAREQHARPR